MKATDSTNQPAPDNAGNTLSVIGRVTRVCFKVSFYSLFSLLIVLACYVSVGRLLMPFAGSQKESLEQQLTSLLGTDVSVGALQAQWFRLGPKMQVSDVEITILARPGVESEAQVHVIESLDIILDVPASLRARSIIIDEIIVSNIDISLTENAAGRWSLSGLAAGSIDYFDQVVEFILQTSRLNITEANLHLTRNDDTSLELKNVYLQLINDEDSHDFQLQFRLDEQPSPTRLHAIVAGNPLAEYQAEVYLESTSLPLATFLTGLLPESLPQQIILDSANVSAEIWLQLTNNGLENLSGNFSNSAFLLSRPIPPAQAASGSQEPGYEPLELNNAAGNFSLVSQPVTTDTVASQNWQLALTDLSFDWQTTPWEIPGLYLSYTDNQIGNLTIQARELDLALLTQIVRDVVDLPEQGLQAIEQLNPVGLLQNMVLETSLDGSYADGFRLQGNLGDVAVGAWSGAPSGSGIQAYIELDQNSGFVELDSDDFTIHLPDLFSESWHYDQINSRVNWRIAPGEVFVNSSVIDVSNESLHGRVQFELFDRTYPDGERQAEITLMVGMLEMDASMKSAYLPTLESVRETMAWLDEALVGGTINHSAYISRNSMLPAELSGKNTATLQSWYWVTEGELRFLPQWPVLNDIEALVMVNNNEADVFARGAGIMDIDLLPVRASLRENPRGGNLLAINGQAVAETGAGLAFLRESPLQEMTGSFLNDWVATGQLSIDLQLAIPLGNDSLENTINVSVLSDSSTLSIPEYGLNIEDIRGRVHYSTADGLQAQALSGSLFDFPIAAGIKTMADDGENITQISSTGRASRMALQSWSEQPDIVRNLLEFTNGEIDYEAELMIYNSVNSFSGNGPDATTKVAELILRSNLLGLDMNFPAPFEKSINEARELQLNIEFFPENQLLFTRFGSLMTGQLAMRGENVIYGDFVFGANTRNFLEDPLRREDSGLLISGDISYLNFDEWQDFTDEFTELAALSARDSDSPVPVLADYLRLAELQIGRLEVSGQDITEVHTTVSRGQDSWQAHLENTLLSGNFVFPDDVEQQYDIELDYLRFPEPEEEQEQEGPAEEIDLLAEVDPGTLPAFDFKTAELSVGDKQLGSVAFEFRPHGGGASISSFKLQTEEASLTDVSGNAGANIDWGYTDGVHTSSFNGLFRAGDLAQVLPGWGYSANLESEQATFISNLQWKGSPVAFSASGVSGQVEMQINKGRFVDIDSGSSRLFGALNFDSIVRRLQLDFSDLYEKGLAYDTIQGKLDFNEGFVTTDGNVVIDGPSSRISIDGEINLVDETIMADMLVNVPLGQNLSVLAGILGAWPIAVSTYVASKIFKDQVDDFTTVLYRLEGTWDDPQAGFAPPDEMFEEPVTE